MNLFKHSAVVIAVSAGAAISAQAAPIFLDFGDTTASGTEKGPANLSGTWQKPAVNTNEQTLSGGEKLRLARGESNSTTAITWGVNGTPPNGTVTANASSVFTTEVNVYNDFTRAGDTQRSLALRLGGLEIGTYDVYLVITDYNTTAGNRAAIGVIDGDDNLGTPVSNGPWEINDLTQTKTALLVDANRNLTTWTASAGSGSEYNYIKASATIDEVDDYLVVFLEQSGTGSHNGLGIYSLQIVPEPTSLQLLGIGAAAMLRRRRLSRA